MGGRQILSRLMQWSMKPSWRGAPQQRKKRNTWALGGLTALPTTTTRVHPQRVWEQEEGGDKALREKMGDLAVLY